MKKLELLKQRFFSFLYHSLLRFNRNKRVKARINWAQEIRIAFLTSILFLLFSTSILWIAHMLSPGELSENRFDQYLSKTLIRTIHHSQEMEIELSQKTEAVASGSLKADTLFVCGTILYPSHKDSSRFLSVWERDEYSFFNELFNTKPKYRIVLFYLSEDEYPSFQLMFDNVRFEDVNDDNKEDIRITLQSHFGSSISTANVFIVNTDYGWKISSPAFSNIEKDVADQTPNAVNIHYETFVFCNILIPSQKELVYSLSSYGTIYKLENPIWSGCDYLYVFAVSNKDGPSFEKSTAFKMMRFDSKNQLVPDKNWNNGAVFFEENEEFIIADVINKNWGIQMEGFTFYRPDVR